MSEKKRAVAVPDTDGRYSVYYPDPDYPGEELADMPDYEHGRPESYLSELKSLGYAVTVLGGNDPETED